MDRRLPRFLFNDSSSWIRRVVQNLRAAFLFPKYVHSSANSAPLYFAGVDLSARHGSAQAYAAIVHATLLCAVLLVLNPHSDPFSKSSLPSGEASKIQLLPRFLSATGFGKPSLGPEGGGNNELRAPTHGELAPRPSRPLMPPRLPQSRDIGMPVPPVVFDPNAPASVPVVTKLGLPWMKDDSDSSGSGKGHGIGDGHGDGMGDGRGGGEGEGESNAYANVLSPVACKFCPEPPYIDEARKLKVQGNVKVEVLVGIDGRAQKIRIVKGLPLGLDQQTVDTIRTWHFAPALDRHRKPVALWVTISFRLI